ncbi:MAG: HAMP domain-containing protein [Rhodocyclaceae bacterium]|nr:HAMP domain-containing protein [Rhodocyclaceae bacterium]
MIDWLPRLFARIPANLHVKLLIPFLTMALLLALVGTIGLQTLVEANRRAEELLKLQRNIAAYRQLQHDATVQLYNVASALLVPEARTLDTTLRQLYVFGYDVDRLRVAAKGDVELLGRVQADYDEFIKVVNRVVELIRAGEIDRGRELQQSQARPLAGRIERLMNELVNRAEVEMLESVDESHLTYLGSRWTVIGFSIFSSLLALLLGYGISQSLLAPVKGMDGRLKEIAAGDFSRHVLVSNRDELGTLAANLNRMNDELGRLYDQLEMVSRHKSDFLANMSHELRTPLNAIIGFSEALLERMFGELNDKQDDYLKDIHSSGLHLLSLINDVLDLSKIEAGHMELECSDFDVAASLEAAVILVRERAQRHGIALGLDVDPALGCLHADERKFKQVLLNLLSNAVKFTPDGGAVTVTGKRVEAGVEIAVADTGIGIAPQDQETVFEEFRQVGRSYTHKQEGTGLGLALTRRIVELHGGRIWLESVPGKGSTFTFLLPAEAS